MSQFEEKSNKRKWQCFICGVNHEDYQTYKSHILEKHDEGREYIKCPDCEAPVRDMIMHYKAKHPSRIMPKTVQTKVAVWRDFKSNGEKKKTTTRRAPQIRTGYFPSKKAGKEVYYRSGLECEFYELLESDQDVSSFAVEPFKVPYYYINPVTGQGDWHDYIPDLKVNFIDGTTQIWEIKPSDQTLYDKNRAKWGSMQDHALNHGWDFIVQTEVGLDKLRHKIKKQKN